MKTWGKSNQRQELELALARIDRLEATLAQQTSRGATGLLSAMVATSQPRIDGRITFADLFVTGAGVGTVSATGFVTGLGAFILSQDPEAFLHVWGGFTVAGGGLGGLRIAGDMVNLAGVWGATFGAILDKVWPEGETEPSRVRLIPFSGAPLETAHKGDEPTGASNWDYELTDGSTIRNRDLWEFVLTAFKENDWTRDGWCGADGQPGRGMSQPLWRALRNTLTPLGVWGTKDRPTLEEFVARTRAA